MLLTVHDYGNINLILADSGNKGLLWYAIILSIQLQKRLANHKNINQKYTKINILLIWKITCSLIGAYIILVTANLLVICLAFHIITRNSTNPLYICPIVISIQLYDYGTHFLRLVDVHLHWVCFVLI